MRPETYDLAAALPDDDLPAYVYDLTGLREHVRGIRAALPDRVELLYAAKANSDPRILRTLAGLVHGFEVASGGELDHVRAVVPGAPVAFGGPGKTPQELSRALDAGAERLHIESEHELRLLIALLGDRTVDVLLRVNLPVDVGRVALAMGGGPFGMDPVQLDRCLRVAETVPGVRLRGLHFHLASGLQAVPHLLLVDKVLAWAGSWARDHGVDLREVNVGGGMGVDYTHPARRFDWPVLGAGLGRILARHPHLTLRIEPGRSVTAYCGWYVTQVLDVKFSRARAFAVLRGGTHHLRTPAAKQHDQPFEVIPDDSWHRPWDRPQARDEPVTLVGQLCTPKDVLADRIMIERLRVGDRVAFAMAGAYAWNISHHAFLMHPRPTFHHLDGEGGGDDGDGPPVAGDTYARRTS
ncbi:type III PLP-dependent enzyme [Streptomyces sp. NPDC093970]|uniref:type III PLP-dependent enzyme n=1 Tax=Streptomyces sp. NPDC093970 TaxID=3155076 RepID=UPI0034476A40